MRCYFHPEQLLHHPRSYYSRGAMRTPQEVPERAQRLLQAAKDLGFDIRQPDDAGLEPFRAVHGEAYLAFLEEAHARWKEVPEDWGDEVMSNIFVREPNALRGILAQAGRYLAFGLLVCAKRGGRGQGHPRRRTGCLCAVQATGAPCALRFGGWVLLHQQRGCSCPGPAQPL